MSEFINNEEMMRKSGRDYFSEVTKSEEKNYNDLKKLKNVDKLLEKDSVNSVSKASAEQYKKWIDESDDASSVKKFSKMLGGVNNYLNANKFAKFSNLSVDNTLNKNYTMPLDEKGLKNLKGRMEDAKKTTGVFDKIHEQTKKYAVWMLVLCALLPFAIPAMLAVGAVILAEYAVHEAVCQYEYNQVIKPLTVNGKNPYKSMLYSKGYKKIEELTAKKTTPEDIVKALIEERNNTKDPKRKDDLTKVIAKYLKENQMEAEKQEELQAPKETQEVKNEQPKNEKQEKSKGENGREMPEGIDEPFNQDDSTKSAQAKDGEVASEGKGGQPIEAPDEVINEKNGEDAELSRGRVLEGKTTHIDDEVKIEDSQVGGGAKQTKIDEFIGGTKGGEGVVSGVVSEVEEDNAIEENSTINEAGKVLEDAEEHAKTEVEVPSSNNNLVEEDVQLESAKPEAHASEDEPVNLEQVNDDVYIQELQPEAVEEDAGKNIIEPENIVSPHLDDNSNITEPDSSAVDEEEMLKETFANSANNLKVILENRLKAGNLKAKEDLATLDKLGKVFYEFANNGKAEIAESYLITLKYCSTVINANPKKEVVFDSSIAKDIDKIYNETFAESSKEEEKQEDKKVKVSKEKFDSMYQYICGCINAKDNGENNEASNDDINVLNSIKNSFDYCYEKEQHDLCESLYNIVYYAGMENLEVVKKQGSFFTNEMLKDLNVINNNIKLAQNAQKQERVENIEKEGRTL